MSSSRSRWAGAGVRGRVALAAATLLAAVLPGLAPPASAQSAPVSVTVFAAASLANVLEAIGTRYRERTGVTVKFSFASSSALARQIEQGAAADLFAAADEEWMDWLAKRRLIVTETRRSLLGNRLVIVAPVGSKQKVDLVPGFDFLKLVGTGRWVTGDPAHVPVGRYAQQALTWLGVWKVAEARLARAENVRAALAFVERGEAPIGIVYETDARVSPKVEVIGVFPAKAHDPISYPFAVVAGRDRPEARALLDFLSSPEARAVFKAAGFSLR
jgi:molybdate transport system substrate-binding protein